MPDFSSPSYTNTTLDGKPVIVEPTVTIQDKTSSSATSEKVFVGFWKRLLAMIIDTGFGYLLIPLFINLYLYFVEGTTLGYRIIGAKIVQDDGSYETLPRGTHLVGRYFAKIISVGVFFLGCIWIGIDAKKKGWHDSLAKTVVVKTGPVKKGWAILGLLWWVTMIIFFTITAEKSTDLSGQMMRDTVVDESLYIDLQDAVDEREDDDRLLSGEGEAMPEGFDELTVEQQAYYQQWLDSLPDDAAEEVVRDGAQEARNKAIIKSIVRGVIKSF